MSYALVKNSYIMESSLFGVVRPILAPWWIIFRRWTFTMLRTSLLYFLTVRKHQKEVKKLWPEIKVFWISLKWVRIQEKTQIKKRLNNWWIIKLEKYRVPIQYSATKIRLILRKLKKFFTCSERSRRINLYNLDIKEPVMFTLQLVTP